MIKHVIKVGIQGYLNQNGHTVTDPAEAKHFSRSCDAKNSYAWRYGRPDEHGGVGSGHHYSVVKINITAEEV